MNELYISNREKPEDWIDYEIADIEVDEEKYNRWVNNCKKNKTSSSWIYFNNLGGLRRKVWYSSAGDCLIYNGIHKGQWGFITKDLNVTH